MEQSWMSHVLGAAPLTAIATVAFAVPCLALLIACNEPAPSTVSAAPSPSSGPAASRPDPDPPPAPGQAVALRPLEGFTSDQPPDPDAFSMQDPAAPPVLSRGTDFEVAALRDGPLELHVLGDDLFVRGAGGLARVDADDRVVPLPHGFTGQAIPTYAYDYWYATLSGRWPDNAWLVTSWKKSGTESVTFVHRRDGDTWQVLDNRDGPVRWYPIDATWRSGQLLGLRNIELGTGDDTEGLDSAAIQTRVDAYRLRFEAYVASPTPSVTPTPMLASSWFARFQGAAAAPTGELFLLGGASIDGPYGVQRWGFAGADAIEGTLDELPGKARCWSLVVRAADDAHVGCQWFGTGRDSGVARLYRFGGARWSEVNIPAGAISVEHVAQAPAGDLWIILRFDPLRESSDAEYQIFHQPRRDGPWTRIELPTLRFPDVAGTPWIWDEDHYVRTPPEPELAKQTWTLAPQSIHVRGPGDVWVVAGTDLRRDILGNPANRHVLLHTAHRAAPLTMLHDLDLDREVRDWHPSPPWRAGEPCFRDLPAFVTLRTLGPDDPANTLESAVKAFVRDPRMLAHVTAIFEVHRRGRRAVGVFANPPDQAAADALLAAVTRIAPDEAHLLECRQPRVRRQFDLRTGRPEPNRDPVE